MRLRQRLVGLLAVLVTCAGGLVATAPSAAADTGGYGPGALVGWCPGWVVGGRGATDGRLYGTVNGVRVAHPTAYWQLYYSPANGGTNCVMTFDNRPGSSQMSAVASNPATQLRNGANLHWRWDLGSYTTYAGGAAIYQMNGKCVQAFASLTEPDGTFYSGGATGWCR